MLRRSSLAALPLVLALVACIDPPSPGPNDGSNPASGDAANFEGQPVRKAVTMRAELLRPATTVMACRA